MADPLLKLAAVIKGLCFALIRAARRLDDHWIGDLIGAACLFGTGYLLFFAAGVLA